MARVQKIEFIRTFKRDSSCAMREAVDYYYCKRSTAANHTVVKQTYSRRLPFRSLAAPPPLPPPPGAAAARQATGSFHHHRYLSLCSKRIKKHKQAPTRSIWYAAFIPTIKIKKSKRENGERRQAEKRREEARTSERNKTTEQQQARKNAGTKSTRTQKQKHQEKPKDSIVAIIIAGA